MRTSWRHDVTPRYDEIAAPLPGDDLVPDAEVVMDRAFTVCSAPELVWPWLPQLGKLRAGWYLPRRLERLIPASRRALRRVEPAWQGLRVGDVIPDYGGAHETFTVAKLEPPHVLVYRSRRGRMGVSWSINLSEERDLPASLAVTRLHLRLRLGPVRRVWLAQSVGGLFDLLTIAGMAAGLRERLREQPRPAHYSYAGIGHRASGIGHRASCLVRVGLVVAVQVCRCRVVVWTHVRRRGWSAGW